MPSLLSKHRSKVMPVPTSQGREMPSQGKLVQADTPSSTQTNCGNGRAPCKALAHWHFAGGHSEHESEVMPVSTSQGRETPSQSKLVQHLPIMATKEIGQVGLFLQKDRHTSLENYIYTNQDPFMNGSLIYNVLNNLKYFGEYRYSFTNGSITYS